MSLDLINAIADALRNDPTISAALTGKVWTRELRKNVSTDPSVQTPGSTPDAFDSAQRIRRAAVVQMQLPETRNLAGPSGAYIGGPQILFYCQPKETEKVAINTVIGKTIALLRGKPIRIPSYGTATVLSIAGRDDFEDDPVLNAVFASLSLQADGVWFTG